MGYNNHTNGVFSSISLTIPWNHAATIFGSDFMDSANRNYLAYVNRAVEIFASIAQ